MSVDRVDPVVRAALRRLPVPEHEPGFWERLDTAVAEQAPVAELVERRVPPVRPITVPPADQPHPVALRPGGSRRRSSRLLAVAAVAAGVLVVVAATALIRSQTSSDEVDTAARTTEPGQAADAGERSPSSATLQQPEGSDPRGGPSVATETVDTWLVALGEGDTATAWELLGPAAKGHWDSEQAFASEASALAEGYGAWAGVTPDVVVATTLLASGEGSIEVVTLVADVAQEGTTERRVLALPVRVTADGARIEPSPVSAGIQPIEPAASPDEAYALGPESELSVGYPKGCASPVMRLDADPSVVPGTTPATALREGHDADVATYRPGSMRPGEHVLTAACLDAESGTVFALATLFEVA